MGKKRKASGQSNGESRNKERQSSKLAIKTYEDVADSEDEFHLGRDKVLLDEGPQAKRLRKWKEQDEFLEESEEEVFAAPPDEDEDEDDFDEQDDESQDEDLHPNEDEEMTENWGTSKRDYYNADAIETEQDALDEEAEALRIQRKQLAKLAEADMGFDEEEWTQDGAGKEDEEAEDEGPIVEKLPQLQVTQDMSPAERLKLLNQTYPEFEPLRVEFLALKPVHDELALAARTAEKISSNAESLPGVVTKYRALAAYMGALAMYFAILTSTAANSSPALAKSPKEMRSHPIMDELVKCKQLWERVRNMKLPEPVQEAEPELEAIEEETLGELATNGATTNGTSSGLSKTQKRKQSKAARVAAAAEAEATARRAERMRVLDEDLATLSALATKSSKQPAKAVQPFQIRDTVNDDDLGEEAPLTAAEAAAKAARKKSLRFYTSQIAQKANKRQRAGQGAGGDDDIPHRERLRDRQARLNAEAERRGRSRADDLGGESDEEDRRVAQVVREEGDEYYDQIVQSNKAKKAQKAALAAAHAAAGANDRVIPTETVGPDGRREISYVISKNKGLTPHRKKESRNPRVKKRMKFEEKKKKLGSVRAVYKGGEGRGGYGGELTGIKKGLVKSVKL